MGQYSGVAAVGKIPEVGSALVLLEVLSRQLNHFLQLFGIATAKFLVEAVAELAYFSTFPTVLIALFALPFNPRHRFTSALTCFGHAIQIERNLRHGGTSTTILAHFAD